ncbi:uncharacterized protein UTRI_02797_B [Ustilago trichophora]|uniref:protein-tyrosine-phosphatase n=1 Tax=Ustilago trichophora TaxID=86804 RepID=A0A5C3E3I6_9BASI|nr:uncharacterized protein UTRI_02797_B [Ustilago trichophora]
MGKRRFSEIVNNVIRAQKSRNIRRSGSCRAYTTLGSLPHHLPEDGVRLDVHTMAAGAAGPPVDDLLRNTIPTDPFWHPDIALLRSSEAQLSNPRPSRSSSTRSKSDLSVTLPSPTATHAIVQSLASASPHLTHFGQNESQRTQNNGVFFLRSDAESLKDALSLTPPSSSEHPFKPSDPSQMHTSSASTEQAASASPNSSSAKPPQWDDASSPHANSSIKVAQTLTASPSPVSCGPDSVVPRPDANPRLTPSGRPILTRLNTSEMLRTQTSTMLELGPSHPVTTRKSPTGLKLQLDTSVPRRSATLSSYPHPARSMQKNLLHPSLPLLTPSTPAVDLLKLDANSIAAPSISDSSAELGAGSNGCDFDAQKSDPHLVRSNYTFEDFDFEVSTILPEFLYLGPNIQSEKDVAKLQALGVHRILNVAYEIDELGPLKLRDRFDRYLKLPMLDSVEAKGVQDSINEACSFLDDARLRSEPVYVHCKAGKSRSVTIVIAYLIHALGWTLQRSYSYVMEKRAAICPNIGFVAELMRYEERELKLTRSTGIHSNSPALTHSPISKSSPQLLPAWGEAMSNGQAKSNDSTPSLSTPSREAPEPSRGLQHRLGTDSNGAFGSTLSKSSPDLPSLAFESR